MGFHGNRRLQYGLLFAAPSPQIEKKKAVTLHTLKYIKYFRITVFL